MYYKLYFFYKKFAFYLQNVLYLYYKFLTFLEYSKLFNCRTKKNNPSRNGQPVKKATKKYMFEILILTNVIIYAVVLVEVRILKKIRS